MSSLARAFRTLLKMVTEGSVWWANMSPWNIRLWVQFPRASHNCRVWSQSHCVGLLGYQNIPSLAQHSQECGQSAQPPVNTCESSTTENVLTLDKCYCWGFEPHSGVVCDSGHNNGTTKKEERGGRKSKMEKDKLEKTMVIDHSRCILPALVKWASSFSS